MSHSPSDRIVWIDCEMTGLDPDIDGLCEVALIITDFDLQPVAEGFEIVIHPGDAALEHMNDFVRNMHTASGLIDLISDGVTVQEAQKQLLEFLSQHVSAEQRPLVAGNSIGMDRRFISKYLPEFDNRLHYRSIDVSTVKELSRRWYPAAFFNAPQKNGGHRALADIAESIREMAYFRDTVFVDAPGPSSDAAKKLSTSTTEHYDQVFSNQETD